MKLAREFWDFMAERERIRLRRLDGLPREQWTSDPTLKAYRFTNVKRAHDYTTRMLVEEFYGPHVDRGPRQKFLNCLLFRFFGTIETARAIGWTSNWTAQTRARVLRIVEERLERGEKVFTGAYIVPNCGKKVPKHQIVISVADQFVESRCPVEEFDHWQLLCDALCERITGMGSFMAKEVVLDYILATGWQPRDWQTWTPVGPGARRGAMIVLDGRLHKPNGLSEAQALEVCRELHLRPLWPSSIQGRPAPELDLTDIQFQLCEFAKYRRGSSRGIFKPREESAR